MKNLQKMLAIALVFMMWTLQAKTSDINMIVRISANDASQVISLQLANLNKQYTKIDILDFQGKEWYTEDIWNEHGHTKKLDLGKLPKGEYLLTVKNKTDNYQKVFSIQNIGIELFETENRENVEKVHFVSNDKKKGEQLIVHISSIYGQKLGIQLANLEQKPATIALYNLKYGEQFTDDVTNENGYAKVLNMSGMSQDLYCISIKTSNYTIIQFFDLTEQGVVLGSRQQMKYAEARTAKELVAHE